MVIKFTFKRNGLKVPSQSLFYKILNRKKKKQNPAFLEGLVTLQETGILTGVK